MQTASSVGTVRTRCAKARTRSFLRKSLKKRIFRILPFQRGHFKKTEFPPNGIFGSGIRVQRMIDDDLASFQQHDSTVMIQTLHCS